MGPHRERVKAAFRVCSRDRFMPPDFQHRDEVFIDHPIRLEAYDFNVSAPHMHVTCLETLDLKPGDR